jgi:hypothetical protein
VTVKGIVDAYGLSHKTVIEELTKISQGDLMRYLNENIDEWQVHEHVSPQYWEVFQKKFPALADTLTVNFQARSITGTPVEQTFCLSATQIRANQSADTNAKNMNHASSVKGLLQGKCAVLRLLTMQRTIRGEENINCVAWKVSANTLKAYSIME